MISDLIVMCNHIHCKGFDHVNISYMFKKLFICNVFVCFLYLLADDVILLTKLVPDFNFK